MSDEALAALERVEATLKDLATWGHLDGAPDVFDDLDVIRAELAPEDG